MSEPTISPLVSGLTPAKEAALRRLRDEDRAEEPAAATGPQRLDRAYKLLQARLQVSPEEPGTEDPPEPAPRRRAIASFAPSFERWEQAREQFVKFKVQARAEYFEPYRRGASTPATVPPKLLEEWRALFRIECDAKRREARIPLRYTDACLNGLPDALPADYRALAHVLLGLLDRPGQMAIVGGRGRGKTWLCCGLVNAFCALNQRAVFRQTRDYFHNLSAAPWGEQRDAVFRAYASPGLLVLDEVQVRDSDRQWQDNALTELINDRYQQLRSTVLLANLEPEALWRNLGASIQRRVGETAGVYETTWPRIMEVLPDAPT
jgi:DNA replication protein DnaC